METDSVKFIDNVLLGNDSIIVGDSIVCYFPVTQDSTITLSSVLYLGGVGFFLVLLMLYLYKKMLGETSNKTFQENLLKDEVISLKAKNIENFHNYMVSSNIYKELQLLLETYKGQIVISPLLNSRHWEELEVITNKYCDNFCCRLSKEFPLLKQEDIHFCLLVKIGFKYSEISYLLGRTVNMMYKRKKLIVSRLNFSDGNLDFEDFIKNY